MARKQTIDLIVQTFKELGGNLNDVLGTRSNISFLGKGKSPELMFDMDINVDALGVLPQSKAVEELTSSVGYAVGNKLNDIQANKLLSNMQKIKNFYNPPAAPANVTDLATRTPDLDKAGLMSLREKPFLDKASEIANKDSKAMIKAGLDPSNPNDTLKAIESGIVSSPDDIVKQLDDIPPPGSSGGPEDIAAPFTGAGLEAIKNVKGGSLIVDDIVNKIYLNAGVTDAAKPVARANARDFLNRVKDLEDPDFPAGTTLSSVMEADDFKFMTEGGGAGLGDPLLLVQKYFGPKVATAVTKLDGPNEIQKFAENLVTIKDAKGNSITSRFFNPETVDPEDFEFKDGGRVPFFGGGAAAGKAFGLAMKAKNLAKGGKMGYQALRKYGIEGRDISRLFRNVAMDKSLVGEEKTAYMKQLNLVLKNPDDFPDAIKDIQIRLGLDPIGFKGGGLAKILEV
tara:strand:- start:812 stop:2176 length:1365 start_codon:yes stop_codon:yes gene_type:complete